MVNKRSLFSTALAAGLALVLVACSGNSDDAGSPAPSTSTSSTPPPSSTPAPSRPASTPSAPVAKPRTATELTKALLALADLPPGFQIEPNEEDDGTKLTSKDPKCASMVRLLNAKTAPGSKAEAIRVFSGGQEGPYVQESLDAMGTPAATATLLATTRKAIESCHKASITIPGAGTSPVSVTEVAPPKAGTSPVAARFAATSGPLEGFEITFVFAGLGDVVLSMAFDSSADIEGPTIDAAAKATKVLGTTKTGT